MSDYSHVFEKENKIFPKDMRTFYEKISTSTLFNLLHTSRIKLLREYQRVGIFTAAHSREIFLATCLDSLRVDIRQQLPLLLLKNTQR